MTDEQQPQPDRDRAGDSTPDAETAAAPDSAPDPAPGSAPDPAPDSAPDWAHSFGGVAEAYDRGRPSYPADAVTWLIGDDPATVLELGAGTGKLTRVLVDLGHDVHATDP